MPKVFEKILCPVAFDRNSAAGLEFAYDLAEPNKSSIYLLHVVSVSGMEPIALEPGPVFTEGIASRELGKLSQQHLRSNVRQQIVVRTGDPATLIVAVADELSVDLIVLPTDGHTGILRMIMGSVAERVVREARRPVLTIRPALGA